MLNDLIDIYNLTEVLGYTDLRSIRKWCSKNKLSILVLGKKNYIHKVEWERVIGSQSESLVQMIPVRSDSKSKSRNKEKVNINDVFNSYKSKR